MRVTLIWNPSCSKSREARTLVEAHDVELELIDYLETPLSFETLRALLAKLDVAPRTLVRIGDAERVGVTVEDDASAEDVARVLAAHPALVERPVLVAGGRAIIARPPSRVDELLSVR